MIGAMLLLGSLTPFASGSSRKLQGAFHCFMPSFNIAQWTGNVTIDRRFYNGWAIYMPSYPAGVFLNISGRLSVLYLGEKI